MTRTKNAEDSVHLWFREMKSGGKSIYLDIAVKGKRKHKYEALHLTLVPEITREDKKRNEHTMKAANAMKAQRILNLTNNVPSTASSPKAKMPLIEWLKEYREARLAYGRAGMSALDSCIVYLERYNTRIRLSEVDVDFITDFVTFMRKQKNRRTGEPLSKNSINRYVSPIRAALNFAVENDYISSNPTVAFDWSSIKSIQTKREYLTIEEVESLVNTPCQREDVRLPFLFACFCGLRVSDIRRLKWKNIIHDGVKTRVEVVQKKTGTTLCLPLNHHALEYLPKPIGAPDDYIFSVPDLHTVAKHLKHWGDAAGITKKMTMHVGRHTFATMTLTTGTDLYTTSRLLGHTNVETTQVYGKIVDSKKQQAVFMVDKLFDPELYK